MTLARALAAALSLAACAPHPEPGHGGPMSQARCEALAGHEIRKALQLPEGTGIVYGPCERRALRNVPFGTGLQQFSYHIPVTVIPKGGTAGAAGARHWRVLIRDSRLARPLRPLDGSTLTAAY